MTMCKHTAWLGLATGSHGTMLLEFNRLQALSNKFPNPSVQTPSLITLVGGGCKTQAIRKLISPLEKVNGLNHADIHIYEYPPTITHDRPILLADYTFPERITHKKGHSHNNCHEVFRRPLSWANQSVQEVKPGAVAEILLARLLAPFTDVMCVFSSDFGGLVGVAGMLRALMDRGHGATLPQAIRPTVFVVAENYDSHHHIDLVATQLLLETLQVNFNGEISDHFSCLTVLSTPGPQALLDYILPAVEDMQQKRKETRNLFALQHFTALFKLGCDHFLKTIIEPFDFVKFSRLRSPVPQGFSKHIAEFLGHLTTETELIVSGVPLIASSILLDSSPPNMHIFDPVDTFRLFYRDLCNTAIQAHPLYKQQASTIELTSLLELQFKRLVLCIEKNHKTSAQLHRETLRSDSCRRILGNLRSETTCFACLGRGPEKGLPCGHAVCETCIQVFGHPVFAESYAFIVDGCLLCGTSFSGFKTQIKPPTAGVRVLSVDGGGIREVVPLSILCELEETISNLAGFSYPIQENFDLAYGTSSGGLIVAGLFLNGWPVEECLGKFITLATKAFSPRNFAHIPFLRPIQDLLISYFADSQYSATGLENALKETFGSGAMLDWSRNRDFGTKVAVTATTIEDSSPCIFSNYNGVGTRSAECGYRMVKDSSKKVSIWEAARCTSAAPWFFKPKCLPGLGTFQDGGLRHNNPINIALWESKIIWSPNGSKLDIVLSMGTGSLAASDSARESLGPRGIWRDGFIPRLVRSFLSSLDGEDAWKHLCNQLPKESKDRYFRFNIKYDGSEPAIDDLGKMQGLEQKGRTQISLENKVDAAESLIAKQFYFELEALPIYYKGRYQCAGRIICRFSGDRRSEFLSRLSQNSAHFILGERFYCTVFQENVAFSVKDLSEEVSVFLGSACTKPRSISGFPTSMISLVHAQGLDSFFGVSNHSKRKSPAANSHVIPVQEKRRRINV